MLSGEMIKFIGKTENWLKGKMRGKEEGQHVLQKKKKKIRLPFYLVNKLKEVHL